MGQSSNGVDRPSGSRYCSRYSLTRSDDYGIMMIVSERDLIKVKKDNSIFHNHNKPLIISSDHNMHACYLSNLFDICIRIFRVVNNESQRCIICDEIGHFECSRCSETYCTEKCQKFDWYYRQHRRHCFEMP